MSLTLRNYLGMLRQGGTRELSDAGPGVEDYAISLWIREHPELTIGLLEDTLRDPIRWQRIAAMLATYHEACSARHDPNIALRRLGGLIAGAVFDNLRKAVEKEMQSS